MKSPTSQGVGLLLRNWKKKQENPPPPLKKGVRKRNNSFEIGNMKNPPFLKGAGGFLKRVLGKWIF